MDWQQEKIFCLKRFRNWAEENEPDFHPKQADQYRRVFSYYIRSLGPVELMREWRVGSNFKRDEIQKLWRFYEERYGEIWYPK